MPFGKIKRSEFFRGSLILLILINIGNVINYLYQIIMARMLGPGDYGTLAVLVSLTYIFAIPTIAIQTGVAKKISRLNSKKEYEKMKGLFFYFLRKLLVVSLVIFVLFSIFSLLLVNPLEIPFWLLVLTGVLIIASFVYPIAAGSLQGMKKFSALGWNTVLIFSLKLIIAVVLVMAGFRVYGAIIGFVLSIFIGFVFALPYLKEIIYARRENDGTKLFTKENILIFSSMLVFVFIYSIDVILAKVFFSPEITGQYAVISMIGKIILFSTMSIGNAMFPISSERHHAGKKTKSLIKKASLSVLVVCGLGIFVFAGFPNLVLRLLFGPEYLGLSNLLLPITITFSFIAFFNILVLYRISVDEFKVPHLIWIGLFLILQVILLSIFNANIEQFASAFMFSSIITFIGAFFVVRKWKKSA